MTEFARVWESSRHNEWSFAYPTAIIAGIAVLAALCFIRKPLLRQTLKFLAVIAFSFLAFLASEREIERKWDLRAQFARDNPSLTENETKAVTADGANRAIGQVAGGGGAFLLFAGLLFSVRIVRRLQRMGPERAH